MRHRINNLSRSIEACRSSLQTLLWLLGIVTVAMAFSLIYYLPSVFRTEASWWQDIEAHWLLAVLLGGLIWNIVSGFVIAHRTRKLLPWLEQRLEQMRRKSGAA